MVCCAGVNFELVLEVEWSLHHEYVCTGVPAACSVLRAATLDSRSSSCSSAKKVNERVRRGEWKAVDDRSVQARAT